MNERVDKVMPYALPLIVLVIVAFYYFVNPLIGSFPIKCVWHDLTGTQCPACGFQRAVHSLSHGRILEALSYNYFFVISIPYAVLAILATWYNYNHVFDGLRNFVYHRYTLKTYVVIFFFWWIVRNIFNI